MQNNPKIRKYIRHPSDVPLEVSLNWVMDDVEVHPCDELQNISLGGLAFKSPQGLPTGQPVSISFPILEQENPLSGVVVWNKKDSKGYEIGVQFQDCAELYRLRMIEQICHIEHYRNQVLENEGRVLNSQQAAKEWIKLFADEFPTMQ